LRKLKTLHFALVDVEGIPKMEDSGFTFAFLSFFLPFLSSDFFLSESSSFSFFSFLSFFFLVLIFSLAFLSGKTERQVRKK